MISSKVCSEIVRIPNTFVRKKTRNIANINIADITLPTSGTSARNSSVDYDQVERFDRIANAEQWFDERIGIFRSLHSFNRVRVPWILAHLAKDFPSPSCTEFPLRGQRILDVGCGGGLLSMALCRLGAEVVGLDPSHDSTNLAGLISRKILAPELRANVSFIAATVEEFASEEKNRKEFDAVVASEVVEHVSNLQSFVTGCYELVKPKKPLFFTTINRTFWSQLFAITLAEDVLSLLPKGLHNYDQFVTPNELRKALLDERCRVGPTLGLVFNPLTNAWSWSNFDQVNYAIVGVKE